MSKITVIGGGVSGLTTAIRLKEAGHDVHVVAREYLAGTTSWVATAIWHLFRVEIDERVERWAITALKEFVRLSGVPGTGVTLVRGIECVRTGSPDAQDFISGKTESRWKRFVPFYKPLTLNQLIEHIPSGYPINTMLGGYIVEVPIANMSVYLPYLIHRLESLGSRIEIATFQSIQEVRESYPGEWYVNCTGLGSRELLPDISIQGVKGQTVRVANDGSVKEYIADDFSPQGMTYILPRGQDIVLGGSADEDFSDASVDPALGAAIIDRCSTLVPLIGGMKVLEHLAGLRPCRPSIRLGVDAHEPDLIHNYGHGGSGVSLSWGCSEEVVHIVTGPRPAQSRN